MWSNFIDLATTFDFSSSIVEGSGPKLHNLCD